MRTHRVGRGFTLIELLVVVAIIALLISILLPSLSRAREQGKTVKCMANLRSMSGSAAQYLGENVDFGWGVRSRLPPYNFDIYSEVSWAGAIPNITNAQWVASDADLPGNAYNLNQYDFFKTPPRFRPLNKYLSSSITWDCEVRPQGQQGFNEVPDFLKCPSDSHPYLPWVGQSNPLPEDTTPYPAWEYMGNSYSVNWYWPYYYEANRSGDGGTDFLSIMGLAPGSVRASLGRNLLRNKDGRFSSEFIMIMENNLDFALEAAKPPGYTGAPWQSSAGKNLLGWHRQPDRHTAAFLDGGARYMKMDTRYVFGTGWTIWPNKPWKGTWAAYNDRVQ